MMLRVILDIFSGMPNPQWSLGLEQSMVLAALVSGLSAADPARMPAPPDLGYRGFEISGFDGGCDTYRVFRGHVDVCGKILADDRRQVETWLLQSARDVLSPDLYADLLGEFGGK